MQTSKQNQTTSALTGNKGVDIFGAWRTVGGLRFDGDSDNVVVGVKWFHDDVELGDFAVGMRGGNPRDADILIRDQRGGDVAHCRGRPGLASRN